MRPQPAHRRLLHSHLVALAAAALSLSAGLGCQCSEDRPYTPFSVASSLPPEQASPPPSASAAELAPERPRRVLEASGLPERFSPFGVELRAPKDLGFVSALELLAPPGDANAKSEAVAWLVPRGKKGVAQLVQFDATGRATRTLVERPRFLPSDKSCQDDVILGPLGERPVALRIVTECGTQLLPGSATGAYVVIDPNRSADGTTGKTTSGAALLTFRTHADYPGEKLGLRAALSDRDGDGTPDLTLAVHIAHGDAAPEALEFSWLLRAVGPSRITDSPQKAFTERAKALALAVPRKAERERAVAAIEGLRRTVLGACAEAGTPRITLEDGTPLQCDLGSAFHELTTGIVNAHVYHDDLARALGEYHRAPSYLGAPASADDARMQKYLARSVNIGPAEVLGVHPLPPARTEPLPTMSPLRYDGERLLALVSGEVLVVHETAGSLPVAPPPVEGAVDGGTTAPPPPEQPEPHLPEPWGLVPRSPNGLAIGGAVPSCDRAEVILLLTDERGSPRERRPLSQLAARPGHCGTFGGGLTVEPLVFRGESPFVVVGGEATLAGDGATVDGAFAYSTRLGLAVADGAKLSVSSGSDLERAHHCLVHPARTEVACLRGTEVVRVKYTP